MRYYNNMLTVISKNKYRILLITITILEYLLCFTYDNLQDYDELSSIALPLYLTGRDWSDFTLKAAVYHGIGHILATIPFVGLFSTWTGLYAFLRIYVLLFWILLALMIYTLCIKYFACNTKAAFVISCVSCFGILRPDYGNGLTLQTELPIGFLSIFLIYFYFSIKDSFSYIKLFLYYFCVCFSLSIHSRALIIIISYGILGLFLAVKKSTKTLTAIFASICGFLTYKILVGSTNKLLFTLNGELQNDANSTATIVGGGLEYMLSYSFNDIKEICTLFLSLVFGYSFLSFGFFTILFIICVKYIWDTLKKQKQLDNLSIMALIGIFNLISMNALLALRQYGPVVLEGDLRWYIYLRYSIPFCILIVISGMIIIIQKGVSTQLCLWCSFINLYIVKFYYTQTIPKIDNNPKIISSLACIYHQFFYSGQKASSYFTPWATIIILFAIVALFIKKNSLWKTFTIYILLSQLLWGASLIWHFNRYDEALACVDKSLPIIEWAEKENINIYCIADKDLYPYYLRTYCLNSVFTISQDYFEPTAAIWLNSEPVTSSDLFEIELDPDEYVYTNDLATYYKLLDLFSPS